MYKGFYEAVVRIDFSIDEKMPDLLSFNEIKAGVEDGELTNQITYLLEKELEPIATVSVKQTGAVLMDIPERQGEEIVTIKRAKEILAKHKKYEEAWAERYRDLTGNRDEWQEENVQALELAITALERMGNEAGHNA